MSAISSFLAPDAPPPSRTISARTRPDTAAVAGQPTSFADFLNAKSNAPEQGDDTTAPVAGKPLAQGDTDQDDSPATPDDEAAALPGNVLPTPPLPLPIAPDPAAPVVARDGPATVTITPAPIAATATRHAPALDTLPATSASQPDDPTRAPPSKPTLSLVDALPARPAINPVDMIPVPSSDAAPSLGKAIPARSTLNSVDVMPVRSSDSAPPVVAIPLDTTAMAKPAITPTILDTLRQATALPTASSSSTTPAPAFRLVAMPAATTGETVPPPRLSSGPLTVTQPAQASATIGLLAAVMPKAAPPPAMPPVPGATATMTVPDRSAATRDIQATPDITPPLAMTTLPSGPLTVTQPGQAAATVGMLASALRDRSSAKSRDEDPIDGLAAAPTHALASAALTTGELARPVTATGAADQAPLDMTQSHWPQGMIERIDRMREDAATADTRIQLSPDALGGIAVAIRRDEGGTHLHFTAEQAGTATMLADAHATLARLAEEKGMRLGDTAVATAGMTGADMGQSMGQSMRDQRAPTQPVPVMPTRPRSPDATLSEDAGAGSSATASPTTPSTRIA